MRENKINIRNDNDFLNTKDIPYNPEQIESAKRWYYNFTGKPYNDDVKELVEIYKILNKTH